MTPAAIAARLRAAGDTEAADCIDRLQGVVDRNRSRYVELQAVCRAQRAQLDDLQQRADRCEATLAVLQVQRDEDRARLAAMRRELDGLVRAVADA